MIVRSILDTVGEEPTIQSMAKELPVEVLICIFSFLPSTKDLCRCCRVCKRWRDALDEARNSPVWKHQALISPSLSAFLKSNLIQDLHGDKAKLVAFENAWNGEDCSHNIELLENRLTLHRNPVAQSTDGIRGKCGYLYGQHYWTVTWHKPSFGSNAVIGVATEQEVLHRKGYCGLLGSTAESWGWDISCRVLRYDGKEFAKYPGKDVEIKIGQTFGVLLDMDHKTLSFDLEGFPLGVAFRDLPPCRLYPAVSAVFGNSEISLVYRGLPFVG